MASQKSRSLQLSGQSPPAMLPVSGLFHVKVPARVTSGRGETGHALQIQAHSRSKSAWVGAASRVGLPAGSGPQ